VITQLHQTASFVRFNEEAHSSDGYASYGAPVPVFVPAPTLALEHALEQYCPLTVGALRLVGAWAADLGDFAVRSQALSHAGDSEARFLAEAAGHAHRLVASVAEFEAAMKKVREGHTEDHVVGWNYSPNRVLATLRDGEPLDLEAARGSYWTIIAHDVPGHYHVLAASPPADNGLPTNEGRQPVGVRY
jgi:hypothetical protein